MTGPEIRKHRHALVRKLKTTQRQLDRLQAMCEHEWVVHHWGTTPTGTFSIFCRWCDYLNNECAGVKLMPDADLIKLYAVKT